MTVGKNNEGGFNAGRFEDRVSAIMGNGDTNKYLLLDNEVAKSEIDILIPTRFCDLPLPSAILVTMPHYSRAIGFCSNKDAVRRSISKRRIVYTPKEVINACWAAENDRIRPKHFCLWCDNKLRWPEWELTVKDAMGGLSRPDPFRGDPFGVFIKKIDAVFRGVEIPNKGN
jgi:hypothetical protein